MHVQALTQKTHALCNANRWSQCCCKQRSEPHPEAQLGDSLLGPASRFLGVGSRPQHGSNLGVHAGCLHGLIVILAP